MNAIDMLKTDHRAIRALFARFDKCAEGDHAGQKQVVGELVKALHSHAAIEEGHFYPAVAKAKAEPKAQVDAASDEHDHMDKMVDELAEMDATHKNFRGLFTKLKDELMTHMREEEREMFPAAKEVLGNNRLGELGSTMASEKAQQSGATEH